MNQFTFNAIVAILFIIILVTYKRERGRLSVKRARFNGREELTLQQLYEKYYSNTAIDKKNFNETWTKVAGILAVDKEKLRPTDRFDSELRPDNSYGAEDELVDLNLFVREECEKKMLSSDLSLNTLDDVIRLLCSENRESL